MLKDTLHRGAKALVDSGEAGSVEEAVAILSGYRLTVYAGPEVAVSPTHQAALLTIVNAGSRCLLGGVTVVGCPDARKRVPLPGPDSLADAVLRWGGRLAKDGEPDTPAVVLGSASVPTVRDAPAVRATFDGWAAAVLPLDEDQRLTEAREFTPSGILAGALAVSEVFQHLRGRNALAMRRTVGLSLWRPEQRESWMDTANQGPDQLWLPEKLWVIGLGHLGQAFIWTLAALPYFDPKAVTLVLQDFDRLTAANVSTSLLTTRTDAGIQKTRRVAQICEERGFRTVLVERPFDNRFTLGPDDPPLAFCGVDNAEARRMLEVPGFAEVIEAGLGHEGEEFLSFTLHSFPASRAAADTWATAPEKTPVNLLEQPAYQDMLARGADRCGLIEVAGVTVAVPFVGAAVSALAVAEAIRAVMGGRRYELIDGTLRDPVRRFGVERGLCREPNNLGFLPAHQVTPVSSA